MLSGSTPHREGAPACENDDRQRQNADIREAQESTLVLLEHEFKDHIGVGRAFAQNLLYAVYEFVNVHGN